MIKTEKADFKLKEVISRIGMRMWVYEEVTYGEQT